MTKTEQNKILENKIKANTLDFNLNRQSAIVSALADGNFDKYEYLTRTDLALKPNLLQKARLEHSPLGNLLNKKLKVSSDDGGSDKKEDKSEPDKEDLSKLDKLLNGLNNNEVFLKDFKTNMDNIDNEQGNKDKQEKLKAIELIENLRDDLEKEMKQTEFLKQKGREAIDLINELRSERDELKDDQTKNRDTLNKLKEGLINLPKPELSTQTDPRPTPAYRPVKQTDLTPTSRLIKQTELSTQTDPTPTPRPIKQTELGTQTDPTFTSRPIKQTELSTQTDPTPTSRPTPTLA